MVRLRSAVQTRTGARGFFQKNKNFLGVNNMGSKKKGAVEIVALQCTECKRKNYTTRNNPAFVCSGSYWIAKLHSAVIGP